MSLPSMPHELSVQYFPSAGEGVVEGTTAPQVCSFYMRTGTCAYGARCKFYHPHPSEVPPPVLNTRGYPVRTQGEPDCAHFLKKGWCAFGMTCKFNHPELLSGPPNMTMAAAQPGSMLFTTSGNTTLLQGPVMYTTGPPGTTMIQAAQAVQPATTVYYVPTASGTFAPAMVQPYTVQDGGIRGQSAATSIMVTQAPSEGQHMYTSATPTSARALYTTPGGGQLYSGAQYVEPQLLGSSGVHLVAGQPGRHTGMTTGVALARGPGHMAGQGQMMSAVGQQLPGRNLRQSGGGGGDVGASRTITYLQDDSGGMTQQLPTSYIQGLGAPLQQMQGGGYLQQAQQAGGMRTRQQTPGEQAIGRHVMLSGARAGDASGGMLQMTSEGMYEQGAAPGSNLMLLMDSAAGRYAQAPSTSSSMHGSNMPSGSMHSGSFPTLLGPSGAGGPSNQASLGAGPSQDMASHERLAQAMKSLRLQKHKLEQYEQQPQ